MSAELSTWNDAPGRRAIEEYVAKVTDRTGVAYVPPEERVAVFDNDGTLWCEKPQQPQVDFILRRLADMAAKDPSLRETQPWRAAYAGDGAWFSEAIVRHYRGDDSRVGVLLAGITKAFAALTVEEFADMAAEFMREAGHPSLGVSYMEVRYEPMVELLGYLEAHGFTNYIASGGGRDFMRPVTEALYGIGPERVMGSAAELGFRADSDGADVVRLAEIDFIDDGPAKPVHIWNRIGRRPILAAGNANGDIPMLRYAEAGRHSSLCLLIDHDDADREFSYAEGAEDARDIAERRGWVVVSMKRDWERVFAKGGR